VDPQGAQVFAKVKLFSPPSGVHAASHEPAPPAAAADDNDEMYHALYVSPVLMQIEREGTLAVSITPPKSAAAKGLTRAVTSL